MKSDLGKRLSELASETAEIPVKQLLAVVVKSELHDQESEQDKTIRKWAIDKINVEMIRLKLQVRKYARRVHDLENHGKRIVGFKDDCPACLDILEAKKEAPE